MLLRPLLLTTTLALLLPRVSSTPYDDIANLTTACTNAANIINASLDNSAALNTSNMVEDIGYEVGASQMNLPMLNSTTVSPLSTNSTSPLNIIYSQYTGSLNTLSEALLRRGQAFHAEPDEPVLLSIQGLGPAIEEYALQLSDLGLISQAAFIRTLTVEDDLVEAESAWAGAMFGGSDVSGRRVRRGPRRRA